MWGVFDVLFKAELNSKLKNSEVRATIFSVSNSIINVGSTIITFIFGIVVSEKSLDFLLVLIICLIVILTIYIVGIRSRIKRWQS